MPRGHFLYEVGKEIQSVDVSLWESDTQVILTNNDSVDFLRRAMSHWRPLEDSGIFLFYFSFLAKEEKQKRKRKRKRTRWSRRRW